MLLASTGHSSSSLTGSTIIGVDAQGIGLSPPRWPSSARWYGASCRPEKPAPTRAGSGEHIGWPLSPKDMPRQVTPQITYRRELPSEDSAMASDLTELGQEAIAAVSRGVADGAPLVKCQLLASAFSEALRKELRKADATKRSTLLAVTASVPSQRGRRHQPSAGLGLNSRGPLICCSPLSRPPETVQPLPRSRPVLRVIPGGLSSN